MYFCVFSLLKMLLLETLVNYISAIFVGCIINSQDGYYMTCYSINRLKNIDYSPHITQVDVIEVAKQQTLLKKDLIHLPNIEVLNLFSALNGIEDGALHVLKNLNHFVCLSCDLPIIKATYFNNPNLTGIVIRKSNICDIEEGAFSKVPNIAEIWFENNHIPVIKKGVFANTNFRYILLQANEIEIIEDGAFFNTKRLKLIELHNNLLKNFDSIKLFGKSLTLHAVRLAGNKLTEITKNTIKALPNLMYFNVSKNDIETIENHSFYNFQHLRTLALSNNRIKELKPEIINENNNLKYLFLDGNDLSYISDEFLMKLPDLTHVTIIGNPWQCACQNDLISYMKKHNIKEECIDIDKMKCTTNDNSGCEYNLGLSQKDRENVKDNSENCHLSWWEYYFE